MSSTRNNEPELSTEETKPLDRRSVLKTVHNDFLPLILQAIQKLAANIKNITFEEVLDASPALIEDYRSLRAFMDIQDLKSHKEEVQRIIQNYINQVLLGFQMANDDKLTGLRAIKSAIGGNALRGLCLEIVINRNYPSDLELPDVDADIIARIRALDLFQHIPAELVKSTITCRNATIILWDQVKALRADPDKFFQPAQPAAASAPKPKAKTASKAAAQQNPSADDIFNQFFGTKNAFFTQPSQPNSRPGRPLDEHMQQMKAHAQDMQKHKKEILAHNKLSNCKLFFGIVNNEDVETIKSYMKGDFTAIKDSFGNNALHLAALCGRSHLVDLLCQHFDVDAKNALGNTALHLAVLSENTATVQALLDNDANTTEDNNNKVDPWLLSLHAKNKDISSLLTRSRSFNPMKTY